MELTIFNIDGKETGKVANLPDEVFKIEPNEHAIYLDVKQYLANQRQGTHKAKERNAVTGSTRKVKKQKGTGSARAGDIKNPLFRGGGRTFGPRPRDYSFKLNKKLKKVARKSALSLKATAGNIIILEDFNFEAPKTKNIVALKENLNLLNKKSLIILSDKNKNIYLSSRNLRDTKVVKASDLNTYDIMNAVKIVVVESSIEKIQSLFN